MKIHNLLDLKEAASIVTVEEEARVEGCSWSHNGRILAVTGYSGSIYLYLNSLNLLASVSLLTRQIAVLSNLKEVRLTDC